MIVNDKSLWKVGRVVRSLLLVLALAAAMLALVLSAAGQDQEGTAVDAVRVEAGEDARAPQGITAGSNSWGNPLPEQINYQGQLVDGAGQPQTGGFTMTFNILEGSPSFALLYSESQSVTTDMDGLFDVMIGSVQPGLRNALDGGDAWLEVEIDGELLAPRQPIGSVAYALYAQHLAGGTGLDSVIAGGRGHNASGNESVVGGGLANQATANQATVAGGWTNSASGVLAVVSGGSFNTAEATGAVVGGGNQNTVTGTLAIVGGGFANSARGNYAVTGGGRNNDTFADYATVGGGQSNEVYADHATIAGGENNEITDTWGTIGGGRSNTAGDTATIGGGAFNTATGRESTIGGGANNSATGFDATIGGGLFNSAGGLESVIGGGLQNTTTSENATIGGGAENYASGNYATIAGGRFITVSNEYAAVGGGLFNTASGSGSMIPGGRDNDATGDYSFAAGFDASADHVGAFVWSGTTQTFASTADHQFLVDAPGGVGINTNAPSRQFHVVDTLARPGLDTDDSVALLENDAPNDPAGPSTADVLALFMSSVSDPFGTNHYITFFDQDGEVGAVTGNGAGGVVYNTSGSDFAEYLPLHVSTESAPDTGMVLGLMAGALQVDTSTAERIFVVSTAPGFVGNSPGEDTSSMALVAFMGQVPVRVRGPVVAGDLLVASGLNDGTAVAIPAAQLTPARANQIVGQALASSDSPGIALVNTLVGQPNDTFWAARLAETDAQLADLAARLTHLEAALATLSAGETGVDNE